MRFGNQSEKEGIVECEKTIHFFSDRFSMEVCFEQTSGINAWAQTQMGFTPFV